MTTLTRVEPASTPSELDAHAPRSIPRAMDRPHVRGKFLFRGGEKLYLRGVTYGPFCPEPDESEHAGSEYHTPEIVERDFAQMAAAGINSVRVYTVPPRWLLDVAHRHRLLVMVGLPWEQHVAFLDAKHQRNDIERRVSEGVSQCANHPAVLAYAIGNEIPASIVRWYGRARVERWLKWLYLAAKRQDPDGLVTYVNFPTTEYLQLPFLDFQAWNVYLEDPVVLRKYLLRLQNLAEHQPMVMGEVGLDSSRNGHDQQAKVMDWQIRTTFSTGAAGMFVFAWTDEWYRGGHNILDWDFGLTTREREPKPALAAVEEAFRDTPFAADLDWPRVSVVICTYNGSRTIAQTLEHVAKLAYPNYEVIVVNDGSRDETPALLRRLEATVMQETDFRILDVVNGGLSRARNIGARAAHGEIVQYLDDDAYPDPHWLHYVAHTFNSTGYAGVGGPNLPVPEDNLTAQCVAHAPGGPNHVLVDDTTAEHIPGCNMAFRREALLNIDGFDERFRIAGDDVDFCWRLQAAGGPIGFHPAAMVWHHRRHSVVGYLKQQKNYGRAEAMLERKWPTKYNHLGHIAWGGRVYGTGLTLPLFLRRWRVYHGMWGSGLFQTLYTRSPGVIRSMPLMPEWWLLAGLVFALALPGILWDPMLFLVPLAVLVVGLPLVQAATTAYMTELRGVTGRFNRLRVRGLIALLHLLQPIVRLQGRLLQGLTPWGRPHAKRRFGLPWPREIKLWQQTWDAPENRLGRLDAALHELDARTVVGGDYDRWDLQVRTSNFSALRVIMGVEEHGSGHQLIRLRAWPTVGWLMTTLVIGLVGLSVVAGLLGQLGPQWVLLGIAAVLTGLVLWGCGSAMAAFLDAVQACVPPRGDDEA
jgi:GT2 family glycosyltransferase